MNLKSLNCPNCGASYNPSKMQCEFCNSYIIMSNENYINFDDIEFDNNIDNEKYAGIYVYGTLLGKGEEPINLGVANYFKGIINVGGKLLLTNKTLSFSSHKFMQGKTDVVINLEDITDAKVVANMLVSQTISVNANGANHRFVVYHGSDWVKNILEAKSNVKNIPKNVSDKRNNDYIEELQKLKKLLDDGIITEEEFNLKKRMLLNL